MSLPGNGIFVVRGEMSTLMTAMRRGARWNSTSYQDEEQDALMKQFVDLKQVLNQIEDLKLIDPSAFLGPFLDVIRTEETTGAITSLALAAVNKFLSYGLIDPTHPTIAATVENIADAVTHARFMGSDQASDAVTLMRVVEVMHTLMRSPEGSSLTNESVCEVMLSCFKICFEPRLNELLRKTAEQALKDMVLLLFMRLPQFSEDRHTGGLLRKFKMIAGSIEHTAKKRKPKTVQKPNVPKATIPRINTIKAEEKVVTDADVQEDPHSPNVLTQSLKAPLLATTPATPGGNIVDMQGKITQTPTTALHDAEPDEGIASLEAPAIELSAEKQLIREESIENDADVEDELLADAKDEEKLSSNESEYVNSVGVRFTQQNSVDGESANTLLPYGLPCIQELFRFLILLCNPLDKQNTDSMMHMGLGLLTVALEVGADSIGKYDTLLALVKDDLCKNLFALLNSERLTIFAADLQVCFLLFESLRSHLKFQLEFYLTKLSEIIGSENPRTPYEMKELSLDNLLQLWRIPGFVGELYINYDCNLYCTDLFENITKLLSKSTLSSTTSIYSTHILSLDTLISVIESLEKNFLAAKTSNSSISNTTRHSRNNSGVERITIESDVNASGGESSVIENINSFMKHNSFECTPNDLTLISKEQLVELKNKKRVLTQGTEFFNQRPEKGIQFLQENGILNSVLDPKEVAQFLRENPGLDKKMIGEYISKKKNVESKILENFVLSFDFSTLRIDQALRLYLETFRLPGEAPLIFLVLEYFADHWHECNNEPFANTDAAFRLAYAIIMLNMDQHNYNAKRLNIPMTPEDFCKNLRGLNGNNDFDQNMLLEVFSAIKNEEIVMPAEQTGLVRENYLWKVLLRRGVAKDGSYQHVNDAVHDKDLFNIAWGPTLTALSFMFDKSSDNGYQRILAGFTKCAGISAYYNLHEDFDALILTLCKFTTLLNMQPDANDIATTVSFGVNTKAQIAMKTVFSLVHEHGDCMRDSWKNILEVIVQLFRLKLLPKSLMEVEDFCEPNGKAALILEKPSQKPDAGLFSSLYSYLSSEGQRQPTYEEQEIIKVAKKCIRECQIDQIISESKFVHFESLQELIKSILASVKAPNAHKSVGLPFAEDVVVFLMEFLVRIIIQNRDRMIPLWNSCRDQMYLLLMGGSSCGYDYLLNRTTIALLKLAIYLMRNEELCPIVLQSLKMLLMLKPNVIYRISKQISIGIYELLKTSAQNIHTETDWQIIFTTLECVGAGAVPPDFDDGPQPIGTKSDGALSSEEDSGLPDRGYISDSEVVSAKNGANSPSTTAFISPSGENWILVNKDSDSVTTRPQSPIGNSLIYPCKLLDHLPFALFKCWDSLAFIVRNVAHITPYNFEICVRCIRTFVESCLNGGIRMRRKLATGKQNLRKTGSKKDVGKGKKKEENSSDSEDEELTQQYETIAIQLLDLMYTLYTRTAQIFRWWAEEGCSVPQCSALWAQGWCPLLQGIARLAVDRRREVRTYAISCLQQRALLVHDLQTLTGAEWANCFRQVLFPLLNELLPETAASGNIDQVLLEESRIRTATIMSKVFLHHLTPLIELPAFIDLWLEILEYIEKFMKVGSDMLYEQMLEILKNMLLVMYSVRIFHYNDGTTHSPLWDLTWKRIGEFLPNLREELFKSEVNHSSVAGKQSIAILPSEHPQQYTVPVISPVPAASNQFHATSKASIILQPPADEYATKAVIVGQSSSPSPQHNVPILIPQATLLQQPTVSYSSNQSNAGSPSPAFNLEQPPVYYPSLNDGKLPDIVTDTTQSAFKANDPSPIQVISPDSSPEHEVDISTFDIPQMKIPLEFSNIIELPETPPPAASSEYFYSTQNPQEQPHNVVGTLPPLSSTSNASIDSPRVPMSHMLAGNQYPSLNRIPPSNIVQSFAPVYIQSELPQSGADIYSDYVQNPYNLTLYQPTVSSLGNISSPAVSEIPTSNNEIIADNSEPKTQVLGVSNMFQSANYFGGVDQSAIPPGSEMLFGQP